LKKNKRKKHMPFTLSRDEVRAKLLSYKSQFARREPIDLPFFPEAGIVKDEAGNVVEDNRLQVREMMGDESVAFTQERDKDPQRAVGRIVARCLLMPDGKTPAFNETDLQAIMTELGDSVLTPILTKIQSFSTGQADAAKNSQTTPNADSTTN
jgi:hypothetical protein